jgi:polyhydroxyalkanoate synthesis regulator phasin
VVDDHTRKLIEDTARQVKSSNGKTTAAIIEDTNKSQPEQIEMLKILIEGQKTSNERVTQLGDRVNQIGEAANQLGGRIDYLRDAQAETAGKIDRLSEKVQNIETERVRVGKLNHPDDIT